MNELIHRLSTFLDWPGIISRCKLAQSGFVYTAVADRVRCYRCSVEVEGWQKDDDPMARHRQLRPDCPVALGTDSLDDTVANLEIGASKMTYIVSGGALNSTHSLNDSRLCADDDEGPIPRLGSRPHHTFLARLATFKQWPKSGAVREVDLARAGFMYAGVSDEVRCAFCQTVVRAWNFGDVPDEQHRRLVPWCLFVMANFCRSAPSQHTVRAPEKS